MTYPLAEYQVNNLWNLRLHVYVVGYQPEGESIIFIISENDEIVFTIVTDCYRKSECDEVSKILESYSKPKIDLFVWTHPHDDHSIGIEQLLSNFDQDRNCHIIIPNGLHRLVKLSKNNLTGNAINVFNYLKEHYNHPDNCESDRHCNYHNVDFDVDSMEEKKFSFLFKSTGYDQSLPAILTILGPESVLALQNTDGTVVPVLNHLSVVYILDVNGLKFLVTGDLSNKGSIAISDGWFKDFQFLKIPHHGSEEPKSFISRVTLNEDPDPIAVSTISLKNKLPLPKVLDKYKKALSNVYVTHNVNDLVNNRNAFGCVHIEFNPMQNSIINSPSATGNAIKWQNN